MTQSVNTDETIRGAITVRLKQLGHTDGQIRKLFEAHALVERHAEAVMRQRKEARARAREGGTSD